MSKFDGGPAFPNGEWDEQYSSPGMTLRDYFAGQALAGLIASPMHSHHQSAMLAAAAYLAADAMLAERDKP